MSDPMKTQMIQADLNKTIVTSAPSIHTTQTIQPVQCPVCKSFNPAGMVFCVECGLIFQSALPDDAFGAPSVRPPCLVDETGREHYLRPGKNVVGREGDVLVEDAKVSRRHAEVTLDGSRVTVTDLGSTNGTKVGGEKLEPNQPAEVANGQQVEFGGIAFTLSFPGEAQSTVIAGSNKTAAMSGPPAVQKPKGMLVGDGFELPLKEGPNTVGRRDSNDVILSDGYVSGAHGVIELNDDGVFYTDLGSTNGSMLNGAKVHPNERLSVKPDDELEIGRTKLKVQLSD